MIRNAVQYIVKDEGGTLELYLHERPSTATVSVENDLGTDIIETANATISDFSASLASGAVSGATSISLSDATGLTAEMFASFATPREEVQVKSVSGSTAELWQPLLYDHATSATIDSPRVHYEVSSSQANVDTFYGGRVIWTIDGKKYVNSCELTKWPIKFSTTLHSLYSIDPGFARFVDRDENIDISLRGCFNEVLTEIGGRGRIHIYTAGPEFNRLVALKYFVMLYSRHGEQTKDLKESYEEQYERKLGKIISGLPVDWNQDEVSGPEERQKFISFPIGRR